MRKVRLHESLAFLSRRAYRRGRPSGGDRVEHREDSQEEQVERLRARIRELERARTELEARLEEAARSGEDEIHMALAGARMGVWDWDMGTSVSWSRETEEIFGVERGAFEGTLDAFLGFIHPDDVQSVTSQIRAATEVPEQGDRFEITHRIVRRDAEVRWLECRGRVYRDEAGKPVKMTGVVRDQTEHKKLEEQLLQSQKMQTIGHLAGGIAHDFNNLLTALSAAVELADRDADGRRENLQIAREAIRHGQHLTRQLLTFAKKQPVRVRPIDPRAALESLGGLLRRLLPETIELDVCVDSDVWNIRADPLQLEQIVVNLAINAAEAMPRGGKLTLSVGNTAETEGTAPPGEHVRIVVVDAGSGICPDHLPRIFDPFFTTKARGTGLGLSTVYGVVQQLEGTVSVQSELGRGTVVTIVLPRCAEAVSSTEQSRTANPDVYQGTVLAVEDNEFVRRALQRTLRARGFTVLLAEDGRNALALAEGPVRVDAVITDVVMPGMSGPELAAELRARRPDLKVLFVSGHPGEMLKHHGLDAHSEFMQKPYDGDALAAVLARMISEAPASPASSLPR
jgi:two-component system, cell cycle sensor histidine kinase and response regulator CckA